MPTTSKTSSSSTTRARKTATPRFSAHEAVKMLTADHKEVKGLFKDYEKLAKAKAAASKRQALANDICGKLRVHTTIEEELFYPAARQALKKDDVKLVDEADVEHAGAKDLIRQIESSSPADDHYDAKVKVLGEQIVHHAGEEEEDMFPKLRKSALDLEALGLQMAARKKELQAELH